MIPVHDVETLRSRTAPIDMDAAAFRDAGHYLVDRIADWLHQMPDGLVVRQETADEVRRALGATRELPDSGTDARTLLDEATELLFRHSLFNGHPRFLGYITSSPAPIGALGELLASAIKAKVGAWRLAPMATEIEAQTIRWIADLIGIPRQAGGLLVSGGNMANFVGFLAARAPGRRCVSTPRLKRTRGFRRRPICSASAPMRFGGSPPMSINGSTCPP